MIASTQTSALFGLHLSAETIRQIIHHAAAEGVGVRAIARLLELDKDTVNRVIACRRIVPMCSPACWPIQHYVNKLGTSPFILYYSYYKYKRKEGKKR